MFTSTAISNLEKVLIHGGLATERGKFEGLTQWQHEYIDHVLTNTKSVVIAARRTGKTFSMAFLTCLFLISGKTVILALPNARTVEGVILDEVQKMLDVLEKEVPLLFTLKRDQTRDKRYSGGGRLLLLSVKGTNDGYGGSFVVIDESQFMTKEDVLPVFEPFVAPFLAIGEGRIVLTGRGGPSQSLIHQASKLSDNPYVEGVFNDVYLGGKYPVLQPEFDAAKGMPLYESHYGCKPIPDDGNYLFTNIGKKHGYTSNAANRYFGIDTAGGVGKDSTVCCQLEIDSDVFVWADHFETKYGTTHEQAEGIAKFIDEGKMRRINRIMIESNFNHGLADELRKNFFHDIKAQKIGYDTKVNAIKALMIINKDGRLIIPDDKIRTELESLIFTVKPNGIWDFKDAHSDYLSALIMAYLCTPQCNFAL